MIGTIWGAAIVGAVVSLAWLGWRRGGPVAVLVVLTLHALSQGHHVDDAGIVYAFAENLAAGHGLVPQPGAPVVEGVSDPLWLALLVPGAFFGEVSAWASLLQAGLMIFVILGVGRLASRVVGPDDPRAAVGVAQLATATSGVVFMRPESVMTGSPSRPIAFRIDPGRPMSSGANRSIAPVCRSPEATTNRAPGGGHARERAELDC